MFSFNSETRNANFIPSSWMHVNLNAPSDLGAFISIKSLRIMSWFCLVNHQAACREAPVMVPEHGVIVLALSPSLPLPSALWHGSITFLGNPTDRGAWRAAVPVVTKCWTWLSMHTHACILFHWSVCLFLCQYCTILINVALCWNPGAWYLQLCSSFSRLLWLFKVFHVSIQILYLFVLVLWEIDCFWQYCHFDSIVIVC